MVNYNRTSRKSIAWDQEEKTRRSNIPDRKWNKAKDLFLHNIQTLLMLKLFSVSGLVEQQARRKGNQTNQERRGEERRLKRRKKKMRSSRKTKKWRGERSMESNKKQNHSQATVNPLAHQPGNQVPSLHQRTVLSFNLTIHLLKINYWVLLEWSIHHHHNSQLSFFML